MEVRSRRNRSKHGRSSNQTEPRILTRFGDLSAKLGHFDDARKAYRIAAEHSPDGEWEPTTTPRDDSFEALKAAAHTAAGIVYGHAGEYATQEKEFKIALDLDPTYWVPYYYLSRTRAGSRRYPEARAYADLAEKYAPASAKKYLPSLRNSPGLQKEEPARKSD